MNSLFYTFRFSRIVRKLITYIFVIELISFVITIILSALILWPLLDRQAGEIAKDLCLQMKSEVEASMADLETASQYVTSSLELSMKTKNYYDEPTQENKEHICLSLTQFRSCQPELRGLVLEGPDRARFESVIGLSAFDLSILDQNWYTFAGTYDYGSGYSAIYDEPSAFTMRSFAYSKSYFIDTDKYILTIYYNAANMLNRMSSHARNTFSAFGLADQSGNLFFLDGTFDIQNHTLREMLADQQGISVTRNGEYFIVQIPNSMWYLVAYADNWALNSLFFDYFYITIFLFAVLCILTFTLIAPLMQRTITPLNNLAKTMGHISEGKLDAVSQIKTGDEIEDLSVIFNDMIRSLNKHMQTQIEHEQKEQRMQYSLLVNQIDPHFICNTMNTINFLARENRSDEIIAINTALIGILQDRLRVDSLRVFDTVSQEVKTVKEYLLIQSCRYENNAQIIWQVDDETWDLPIPKNIIQPLVENALFHGLMDANTGEIRGNITVDIQKENDGILIRVRDDGKGIETEQLKKINEYSYDEKPEEERGKHIGLQNIWKRLDYLYHNMNYMKIESDNGTTVSIRIPIDID